VICKCSFRSGNKQKSDKRDLANIVDVVKICNHIKNSLLNFGIMQCHNVIYINKRADELSFSCDSKFNLYPKLPCESGNFWDNFHIFSNNSQLTLLPHFVDLSFCCC